ncbi:MAG: SDR family oxidoreductase [Ornithinimicrobium sp.]
MNIALTGVTGQLGGRVAQQLADLSPRLVVRDPSRAPDIGGSEVTVASFDDTQALARAFAGIDTLLLVSAAESDHRRQQHRNAIRAAADAGVGHILYTSFDGAAPDAEFTLGRDHADAEEAIRETGMQWTFLRNNFYADVLPFFADEAGVIRGPAGQGRVAVVARADVADVAAVILRDPPAHAARAYHLTGPEALTVGEAAERLSAHLGRAFSYEEETVDEAYASRRTAYPQAAQFELDAWVSTYTAIASGDLARISSDVPDLTGHPARTLEGALK